MYSGGFFFDEFQEAGIAPQSLPCRLNAISRRDFSCSDRPVFRSRPGAELRIAVGIAKIAKPTRIETMKGPAESGHGHEKEDLSFYFSLFQFPHMLVNAIGKMKPEWKTEG